MIKTVLFVLACACASKPESLSVGANSNSNGQNAIVFMFQPDSDTCRWEMDLSYFTVHGLGDISSGGNECQVTPVIHVLQYPGCVPKPIPSFACIGRCSSYLQVSGSKIWQMERSCMCCQESGEREAAVSLFCPKAKPGERKFRKVSTKAPLECMCRPCSGVEESAIIPQEIAGYADEGPLTNHFRKAQLQ